MGGVWSAEDRKFGRQNADLSRKRIKRIFSMNDMYRCQGTDNPKRKEESSDCQTNNRNFFIHIRNGSSVSLSRKSQSLDTIFEELTKEEAHDRGRRRRQRLPPLDLEKPLIPRIKLTPKNRAKTKGDNTNRLLVMTADPDSTDSCDIQTRVPEEETVKNEAIFISNGETLYESAKNPEDNHFTRNFDECMKRLQLLEKEHELMERDDSFYRTETETADTEASSAQNDDGESAESRQEKSRGKSAENEENAGDETAEASAEIAAAVKEEEYEENDEENGEKDGTTADENSELISKWYSNLKQQFERHETDADKPVVKAKEMSCRITGATLKNPAQIPGKTEPEEPDDNETRHYFLKLVKSNRSLIDEELPDPDLVKSIRAKFQENANSTLKRRLNGKLGGSLQNISSGKVQSQHLWRPLSAQCNREDIIGDAQENSTAGGKNKMDDSNDSITKDSDKEPSNSISRMRFAKKFEKDSKTSKDLRTGRLLPSKWTDSGSVSSGVSSDLSSYDTDFDNYSKEEPEPEPYDPITISDDDLTQDMRDKHYVQSEILDKIRSFGTSVTYYGGEMITCSVGPLLSPTTQAIMEEITEKYRQEKNISRTFEEFYRKYVETNDPSQKKKIGRTRSFGQSDVFYRPNPLTNTEIEMYKHDLEMEIGIRKPKGLPRYHNHQQHTNNNNNNNNNNNRLSASDTPTQSIEELDVNRNLTESPSDENQQNCPIQIVVDEDEGDVDGEKEKGAVEVEGNSGDRSKSEQTSAENRKASLQIEPADFINNRKKPMFERCQSTPHEVIDRCSSADSWPSQQILFGYDKNLLADKNKSDMEFEEFQISESGFREGRKGEAEGEPTSLAPKEETEISAEPEPEATIVHHAAESKENFANKENVEMPRGKSPGGIPRRRHSGNSIPEMSASLHEEPTSAKPKRRNNLRWPVETRGAVDIQKTHVQPMVVFPGGKYAGKHKMRLF